MITRDGGVIVSNHAYYPFGSEMNLSPQENPADAIKFTGHERDIVAGDNHSVDYMHARYYNANLGRFLEVDKHPGLPSRPQTWNRYDYAFNNPLMLIDPNGAWPTPTHEAMLDRAFPKLDSATMNYLKLASRQADDPFIGGQNNGHSYQHGMREQGQSVNEAQALAGKFYTDSINTAIAEKSAADKSGRPPSDFGVYNALGAAMHLVMDLTSPAHIGFQVWNWPQLNDDRSHVARESRAPTEQEMNAAVAMMRTAFAQVFGQAAADAASGLSPEPPVRKSPDETRNEN